MKLKKGLSLIEMAIILVIIGVFIGTIVGAGYLIHDAKVQTTKEQVFKIKKAVDNYMINHGGFYSYTLLAKSLPNFAQAGGSDTIWTNYFNKDGKPLVSGFGTPWNVSVSGGELELSVNTDNAEDCNRLAKSLKNQVTQVLCSGNKLEVYFGDEN